jgi:hypothetical protein
LESFTSNRTPLLDLPAETLQSSVAEVVRNIWVRPHPAEPMPPLSEDQLEKKARAVLDALLTCQFRVGPFPTPDLYESFLEATRCWVRRGKPIRIFIGYGSLKNQNTVSYSRADWADFFALCRLVAWHNKVQRVYPPGLRLQLLFDDEVSLLANRVEKRLIKSYISSISGLLRALQFESIFPPPSRLTDNAWYLRFGPYQLFRFVLMQIAERSVRRWERNPVHAEQVERMAEYAKHNLVFPADVSAAEQDRQARAASHRFRVSWDALAMGARIFSRKDRLIALYLDGSQHHRRQTAMHLFSVAKGQVTQPWQGEGVLLDNGHGRLVPFVMTAGRRPHYHCRILDDLAVVPQLGFERIAVVCQRPGAEERTEETTAAC